jgi:hypothetical protein
MPSKKKVVEHSPSAIQEPPVIFFLKVNPEDEEETAQEIQPRNGGLTNYADILREETAQQHQRFDEKMILDTIAKIHTQTEYAHGTACFWCCHGFGWKPFVLPVYYDAYNENYTAEGHYCSPECALADLYSKLGMTDSQRWYRHSLLRDLYGKLYRDKDLNLAPDRKVLRMFGGTLDIEQYRAFLWNGSNPLASELPPIRLYIPSMNTQTPARDIKKFVSLSSETVEKATQQLRLKRSKPVHANVPTLDQCMVKK